MEKEDTTPVLGFWKATFLQLLNIKGVLYALTLYATFLSPLAGHYGLILLSGVILGAIAVISWPGAGSRPRVRRFQVDEYRIAHCRAHPVCT